MKGEKDFYLPTDHEILELVQFHEDALFYAEKTGKEDPEREQKIAMLGNFKTLIQDRVKQRMDAYLHDQEQERKLFEERSFVDCDTCQAPQHVKILGEERHPVFDTMNDLVECTVCSTHFFNDMPNNWDDRIKYFDFLTKHLIEGKGDDNFMPLEERMAAVAQMKKVSVEHTKVLETERAKTEAHQKAEQALIGIRDYLLQTKLAMYNFNNNTGSA